MINDPVVEDVRRHRQEHAERYGHDLKLIVEALRERERHSAHRVISPGPKYIRIPTHSGSALSGFSR